MLKFLVVVALLALAVYLVARAIERRGLPQRPRPRPRRPRQQPTRPVAPDDDPDFLRDLDRRRSHPEDPDSPT